MAPKSKSRPSKKTPISTTETEKEATPMVVDVQKPTLNDPVVSDSALTADDVEKTTIEANAPIVAEADEAEKTGVAARAPKKRKTAVAEGGVTKPKRRNTSGFVLFQRQFYKERAEEMADMDFRVKSRACGDAWHALDELKRAEFRAEADAMRAPLPEKKPRSSKTTSFFMFVGDVRAKLKEENPTMGAKEIAKLAGEMWRGLDEGEKNRYAQKAADHNQKQTIEPPVEAA